MRAAFRADASREIGTGHVMRCLTLADALKERGWETLFLCREFAGNLIGRIRAQGHGVAAMAPGGPPALPDPEGTAHAAWLHGSWQEDASQAEAILGAAIRGSFDWLVADHYALDARWESRLRARAARILAIDDLADRSHACDALLDQNLRLDAGEGYAARVPSGCRMLLGPAHALLRPEFGKARSALRERPDEVKTILVFLGGSDPENHTGRCLEALASLEDARRSALAWEVVIGPSNPHAEDLRKRWGRRPRTRFHQDARDMASLIAGADLALAGGGVSTWERLCLGLPTAALSIAFNQEDLLEAAAREGLVLHAGRARDLTAAEIAGQAALLIDDPDRRRAMSRKGMQTVDGRGCLKVAAVLEGLSRA